MATTIRSTREVAAGQRELILEGSDMLLDAHVAPGQYCTIRAPGDEPAHFALWSTPGERTLRFLVRTEGIGERLAHMTPGSRVSVSAPTGSGFDLTRTCGLELVFVATGTGIAPVRAALTTALADRAAWKALTLYYGLRGPTFDATGDELSRWRNAGVLVTLCYSQRPQLDGGRYVQEVVADELPSPTHTAFVVAGHEEVVTALAAQVARVGAPADRIVLNH